MDMLKNREFKFKIWDTWDKHWIDQKLFSINEFGVLHPSFGSIEDDKNRFFITQYTGLNDKNGVEIYEGDILEFSWSFNPDFKQTGYVVFWEGKYRLAKGLEKECPDIIPYDVYGDNDTPTRLYNWKNMRVSGNIFETPELLEK